jgi:hypothetical protein
MGSKTFMITSEGRTADEAFNSAVGEAQTAHGNEGYTGTIAEKQTFQKVGVRFSPEATTRLQKMLEADEAVDRILDSDMNPFDDKWGPAGCMVLREPTQDKPGEYIFFGWASC